MNFDGDFEFLPLRARIEFGEVPMYPTYEDFALAVTQVESTPDDPAAHWRVEAIRARRLQPGVLLNDVLKQINTATSARLYQRAVATM